MPDPSTKPRRRRLLRFGLRGLMLAVLAVGCGLGWLVGSGPACQRESRRGDPAGRCGCVRG